MVRSANQRLIAERSATFAQIVREVSLVGQRNQPTPSSVILPALILILAAVVRLLASSGDFWLDEIWSLANTLRVSSAIELLTYVRHDNNHFLNSWIMYVLGPDQPWIVYRLPAVLAGVGSVAMAGCIVWQHGRIETLTTMLLMATSYLCVHYSSEARGYSYVVFFSLLCFYLMRRTLDQPASRAAWWFGLCAVLGLLSHLTFVYCYASLVVWSTWRLGRQRKTWSILIRCHALPVVAGLWLYFANVRDMLVGGGHVEPIRDVVLQTLSLSAGGPNSGALGWLAAGLVVCGFAAGLMLLKKHGQDAWLFYLGVSVIGPATFVLLSGRDDFYVRYFLLATTFLLLPLSCALASLARRGRIGAAAYAVLLVIIVVGNATHVERLLRLGRGGYRAAIERVLDETAVGQTATISSDSDARNGRIIAYYQPRIPRWQRLEYCDQQHWPAQGPQWYIQHRHAADARPKPVIASAKGVEYHFVAEYRTAGLSGWNWFLYRRCPEVSTTADARVKH